MAWCRLAWEKLHVPPWYAKQITPQTEFEKYLAYESIKLNQHEKRDYYDASIVQAILAAAGAENATLEGGLINFRRTEPKTEAQFEAEQIAIWEAATGKKVTRKKG